jgi:hypothetical protein
MPTEATQAQNLKQVGPAPYGPPVVIERDD